MPRRKKNARRGVKGKRGKLGGARIPKLEGAECAAWLERRERSCPDRQGANGRQSVDDKQSVDDSQHAYKEKIGAVTRGEIWYADLGSNQQGCVQRGNRPVLIVSNNENNLHSSTVTVIPMTTRMKKVYLKTHVILENKAGNPLTHRSMALAEQITTIDKAMLINCVGTLELPETMNRIEEAIRLQTGC